MQNLLGWEVGTEGAAGRDDFLQFCFFLQMIFFRWFGLFFWLFSLRSITRRDIWVIGFLMAFPDTKPINNLSFSRSARFLLAAA